MNFLLFHLNFLNLLIFMVSEPLRSPSSSLLFCFAPRFGPGGEWEMDLGAPVRSPSKSFEKSLVRSPVRSSPPPNLLSHSGWLIGPYV